MKKLLEIDNNTIERIKVIASSQRRDFQAQVNVLLENHLDFLDSQKIKKH